MCATSSINLKPTIILYSIYLPTGFLFVIFFLHIALPNTPHTHTQTYVGIYRLDRFCPLIIEWAKAAAAADDYTKYYNHCFLRYHERALYSSAKIYYTYR